MKKIKYFIAIFGIVSIFLVGCSNVTENEDQYIVVQNPIGEENKYENFIEITDDEQTKKVTDILNNLDWENSIVHMVRPPDYKFRIEFKNTEVKAVPMSYELWISPNKDKVELVTNNGESKYVQLDNNQSAELFKILTGKELSDIK